MVAKDATLSKHSEDTISLRDVAVGEIIPHSEALQRHLSPRQVQFFSMGGAIGTALFVTIGYGLLHGGAGGLLLAFIIQACIMGLVNSCLAEMTTFMPVSAAFIQHADVWVDKAWGFMIGWNFFLFEALLIPFEITAFDLVLTFWRDDIPSAAVITACIVLYGYVLLQQKGSLLKFPESPTSLRSSTLVKPSSGYRLANSSSSCWSSASLSCPCAVEIPKAMLMVSPTGRSRYGLFLHLQSRANINW